MRLLLTEGRRPAALLGPGLGMLEAGDVVAKGGAPGFTVAGIRGNGSGRLYRLRDDAGVLLRRWWTADELRRWGYGRRRSGD